MNNTLMHFITLIVSFPLLSGLWGGSDGYTIGSGGIANGVAKSVAVGQMQQNGQQPSQEQVADLATYWTKFGLNAGGLGWAANFIPSFSSANASGATGTLPSTTGISTAQQVPQQGPPPTAPYTNANPTAQ